MRSMKTRSGGEPPPGGLPYGMTSVGGPVPARGAQGEPDAQAEPAVQAEPEAGQVLTALYEAH